MDKAEAGRLGLGAAAQEGSQSVSRSEQPLRAQEWALTIPKTFRRGLEALEWQMRSTGPFEGLQC